MAANDCTSPRFSTEEPAEISDLKSITASPTEESPLDDKTSDKSENENNLGGPSFYPPLYIQRYTFVKEILDTLQPDSVSYFNISIKFLKSQNICKIQIYVWSLMEIYIFNPQKKSNLMLQSQIQIQNFHLVLNYCQFDIAKLMSTCMLIIEA